MTIFIISLVISKSSYGNIIGPDREICIVTEASTQNYIHVVLIVGIFPRSEANISSATFLATEEDNFDHPYLGK